MKLQEQNIAESTVASQTTILSKRKKERKNIPHYLPKTHPIRPFKVPSMIFKPILSCKEMKGVEKERAWTQSYGSPALGTGDR
jgi:hypothetical protein